MGGIFIRYSLKIYIPAVQLDKFYSELCDFVMSYDSYILLVLEYAQLERSVPLK